MMNKYTFLINILERNRNIRFIVGFIILLFGLSFTFLFYPEDPYPTQLFVRITGGLIGAGGLLIIFTGIKMINVRESDLVKQLEQHPEKIVWVYPYVVENMPYGVRLAYFGTLYFMLDDGRHHSMQIKRKEKDMVMDNLKPILPHATFGYSVEKEQLYLANPLLLKRSV